jgi:hypothetical protein
LNLTKVSVAIAVRLVRAVAAVVGGTAAAQADGDAHEAGEDDEETAHRYQHNPRKLHAENEILCRVWRRKRSGLH